MQSMSWRGYYTFVVAIVATVVVVVRPNERVMYDEGEWEVDKCWVETQAPGAIHIDYCMYRFSYCLMPLKMHTHSFIHTQNV